MRLAMRTMVHGDARTIEVAHETWPIAGGFRLSRGLSWEVDVVTVTIWENDAVGRGESVPYVRYHERVDMVVEQILTGQTPRSYNNASPAWSPDGSRLAFVTDRTGRWEIWVMNADGSNQQSMFPAGTLDGIPLQYNGMDERMLSWR